MKKQKIGNYDSFILEADDMVVVMGQVEKHQEMLQKAGFELNSETGEYVGLGSHLYALQPDAFYDLFSTRAGEPELIAQATDQKAFYQIDALPVVEGEGEDQRISQITALDFETRTFIEQGVSNFRVG